ncbi:hypothetical protein BpHYR1_034213 [Brachionus plicatilis]|uniref:Uncharacterized protein n=1 Tax=Brachionus plicatilis TaxID=10195 RepID=A0A3M7SM35_BRAPC|nr:hypothetical protein BpHYR1_034213 [Brachionus plicatilis]
MMTLKTKLIPLSVIIMMKDEYYDEDDLEYGDELSDFEENLIQNSPLEPAFILTKIEKPKIIYENHEFIQDKLSFS